MTTTDPFPPDPTWDPAGVLAALQAGACTAAADAAARRVECVPDDAEAWFLLGAARQACGAEDAAAQAFERAQAIDPLDIRPRAARGALLAAAGAVSEALAEFETALALAPRNPRLLVNAALAHEAGGRTDVARAYYDRALAVFPGMGDALQNRAALCLRLGDLVAARADAERLVQVFPGLAAALELRAACALAAGDPRAAQADFDQVLADHPNRGEAWAGRAVALAARGRLEEASAALTRGRALDAAGVERYAAAVGTGGRADGELLDPARLYLYAAWERHRRADWREFATLCTHFDALVAARTGTTAALRDRALLFAAWQLPVAPDTRRALAADVAREVCANARAEAPSFAFTPHGARRLRVGYLSADFRRHPGAQALLPLFRQHDRSRFEIHAYSLYHVADADQAALAANCDRYQDVSALDDADIAARIHADGIDILVEKSGYAAFGRAEVLAMRPAPLRVSYLGSPGSLGPGIVDYRISDVLASPDVDDAEFSEALLRLPHGHILLDGALTIPAPAQTRAELGLPDTGFVYACHNSTAKIEPGVWACWMRVLAAVPQAVLWLLDGGSEAVRHLRAAAAAAGIAPTRLVFAPRADLETYRSRLALADLYLDTLVCNAHVTANDVLLAGLPLLTCRGNSWAGRIAASQVSAAGLAELVCADVEAYVQQAVALAAAPARCTTLRARLAARRDPLFDTAARVRDYERALAAIWDRHQRGLPPVSMTLDAETS